MKKYLLFILLVFLGLQSCKVGTMTESRGLENESFLQFVQGNQKYSEGVLVFVDDLAPFTAKVDKIKSMSVKGNVYTIKSGTRHVKVVYRDQVLFEKDVVVSAQQTRKIQLP
ncbi:MAG: hypothetical protein LBG77_02025 [Dysgonamonadaceae bacterium]|jgi:hypothetical protein|nr:hypothetical protein [Dysgonamonadaceae bacterium]